MDIDNVTQDNLFNIKKKLGIKFVIYFATKFI